MKKITFIIVTMMVITTVMAQNSKKKDDGLISKEGKVVRKYYPELVKPSSKSVYLIESFDNSVPPNGWTESHTITDVTKIWVKSNPTSVNFNTIDPTSTFSAIHPYIAQDADDKIISLSIDVTSSTNLRLTFYCGYSGPWMIGGSEAGENGADVRVLISNDGGINWTQIWSYVDTHVGTETWKWERIILDLQENYGGQSDIKIAFQYFGNDGDIAAIDNVLLEDYVPPTHTDLVLTAIPFVNSKTPLAHASSKMKVYVENLGAAIENDVTINTTITPGTFSEDIIIETPFDNGDADLFSTANSFVPTVIGTYETTFSAPVENDPTPDNNESSFLFEITSNTFATDNGAFEDGIGSSTSSVTFGNLYSLAQEDIITSFSIGFYSAVANNNFLLSIYSVNPQTGEVTLIYSSGEFSTTLAMNEVVTEFNIEPQTLQAGLYFFAVKQLSTSNSISIASDMSSEGLLYILNTTTGKISYDDGLGNIFIRVNTFSEPTQPIATVTPESWNAGDVLRGQSKVGDFVLKNTGVGTLTVSEISTLTGDWTTNFNASLVSLTAGQEYSFTITFAPTVYGASGHDFIITTNAGAKTITLSGNGDGISVPTVELNKINIYPNPSNGEVNINVSENSLVKVYDVTGRIVEEHNVNANSTLNFNQSKGVYSVQIESNGVVKTQKLIIQ